MNESSALKCRASLDAEILQETPPSSSSVMEKNHVSLMVIRKVPRVDGHLLSYTEFLKKFMKANEPVILSGLMEGWQACKDWVTENQTPNLSFFSSRFGRSRVQVAECNKREFPDQQRVDMTVSQFVDYWEHLNTNLQDENTAALFYLKDWHLVKEYPDYHAYTTPEFFLDDWLNFYMDRCELHVPDNRYEAVEAKQDESCSDYRFVYMGPKGTWTPLHADVFRSYSWSGNVCGRKLWHLLPPSQTHLLYDRYNRKTVYDIYGKISAKEFPGFDKTRWLECVQDAREILFVPSGWYHQVTNLEDVISINHNWFNACNLQWVWGLLLEDYNESKASIEDIRSIADDFESLCQRNLAANSGMNFRDFFLLITHMTKVFLSALKKVILELDSKDSMKIGVCNKRFLLELSDLKCCSKGNLWQVLFNLKSIVHVLKGMHLTEFFQQEDFSQAEMPQKASQADYGPRNLCEGEDNGGCLLKGLRDSFANQVLQARSSENTNEDASTGDLEKTGTSVTNSSGVLHSFQDGNAGASLFSGVNFSRLGLDGMVRCKSAESNQIICQCKSLGLFEECSFSNHECDLNYKRVWGPKHLLQFIQSILGCFGQYGTQYDTS